MSKIVIRFEGFQRGAHPRAIHEYLRAGGPRTFEEIVRATHDVAKSRTEDVKKNARGHLNYWTRRGLYVKTRQGWMINPRGIQFDPREFAD